MPRPGTRRSDFHARRSRSSRKTRLLLILRKLAVWGGLGVFVLWLGAWVWLGGLAARGGAWVVESARVYSVQAGLALQDVFVEGRVYTNPEHLKKAVGIEKGAPLLGFDPEAARIRITLLPWVRAARVERRWPASVYVHLEEYVPLAIWQRSGNPVLIDSGGHPIEGAPLDGFLDFLIVTGERAPEQTPLLMSLLAAEPDIMNRAEAATLVGGRRWDITLRGGIVVRLPEEDMGFALRRLARIDSDEGLLEKGVRSVDLRETDRLIIQMDSGDIEEKNDR